MPFRFKSSIFNIEKMSKTDEKKEEEIFIILADDWLCLEIQSERTKDNGRYRRTSSFIRNKTFFVSCVSGQSDFPHTTSIWPSHSHLSWNICEAPLSRGRTHTRSKIDQEFLNYKTEMKTAIQKCNNQMSIKVTFRLAFGSEEREREKLVYIFSWTFCFVFCYLFGRVCECVCLFRSESFSYFWESQ